MTLLHQKALAYLVAGYSIIPVGFDKRPLLSSWKEFQSRHVTEEELEQWINQWPNMNIAIVTGEISGITVIDIDTGGETITPLSSFPETYTVKTPTEGYHLFYKYNPNINQTANTFSQYPHVDIRNTGGFVVAVPSHCKYIKNGKQIDGYYEVYKQIAIKDFPVNLFPVSEVKKKHDPKLAFGAPEGTRNDSAAKVIGHILSSIHPNYWLDFGLAGLREWNKRNNPPLPDEEIVATYKSIASRQYAQRTKK